MAVETLNARIRIGYEDLGMSQVLSINYVVKLLGEMPQFATIVRLSSINLILANEKNSPQTEQNLRRFHLNPGLQREILNFEQKASVGDVFNRQAALLLIHLSRHFSKEKFENINKHHIDLNIGLLFLLANDFISNIEDLNFPENDMDQSIRMLAAYITRQNLYHYNSQERYIIPQSWLIFEGLKEKARKENIIDLGLTIQNSRGYNIEEYYIVLMALYSYWGHQTLEEWDLNHVVINPKNIFTSIKVSPDKYLKILDSLSVNVIPSKKAPCFKKKREWVKEIYEQFELRLRPLIKIGEVYICSDFEYIKSAFWDGPYHTILTDYPQSETSKKMLNFLGDTTEYFIRAIGKDAFNEKFIDIINKAKNPLGDGVIRISDDWIVIIESKAARPGIDMISGDKPITELRDFEKLVRHGLTQLNKRIQEYRTMDGFRGRITPILITAGHIPQHEKIWDLMEIELKSLGIMNDPSTDFPFLLDLESWNVICAAQKSGISIEEIINLRNRDRVTKTSNPSYFLYEVLFNEQNRSEPSHPVLISLFEDRMHMIIQELFQRENLERRYPEGLWRSLFKI